MNQPYKPNVIPATERFINILYAVVLMALAGLGLWKGTLLLPGKRTGGPNGAALSGVSAITMYGAILCACIVLLSTVVDHYDRRNNERAYRQVARVCKFAGWSLFVVAMAVHAFS